MTLIRRINADKNLKKERRLNRLKQIKTERSVKIRNIRVLPAYAGRQARSNNYKT